MIGRRTIRSGLRSACDPLKQPCRASQVFTGSAGPHRVQRPIRGAPHHSDSAHRHALFSRAPLRTAGAGGNRQRWPWTGRHPSSPSQQQRSTNAARRPADTHPATVPRPHSRRPTPPGREATPQNRRIPGPGSRWRHRLRRALSQARYHGPSPSGSPAVAAVSRRSGTSRMEPGPSRLAVPDPALSQGCHETSIVGPSSGSVRATPPPTLWAWGPPTL